MSKIRDILLDLNPSRILKDRFRWDVVVHEKIQSQPRICDFNSRRKRTKKERRDYFNNSSVQIPT